MQRLICWKLFQLSSRVYFYGLSFAWLVYWVPVIFLTTVCGLFSPWFVCGLIPFFLLDVSTSCLRFLWHAWSLWVCLWFIYGVISVIISPSRFDSIFIVGFLWLPHSLTAGFALPAACGVLIGWSFFLYSCVALPARDVVLICVLSVCWLDCWLSFSLPMWSLHALSSPRIL